MPTTEKILTIPCPKCGKRYRWKPKVAGKKVKCHKCQTSFPIPVDPPLATDAKSVADAPADGARNRNGSMQFRGNANPYSIDDPDEPTGKQPATKPCPSCGHQMGVRAVICPACSYNTHSGQKIRGDDKAGGAGSGKLIAVVAMLLVLAAAAAAYYFFFMR